MEKILEILNKHLGYSTAHYTTAEIEAQKKCFNTITKEISKLMLSKERVIEVLKKRSITTSRGTMNVALFGEDEFESIANELTAESDESKPSVFLIHRDGNTTRIYKNGVKISPAEFTEFYGCKLTDEQKELLRIAKNQYFEALESNIAKTETDTGKIVDIPELNCWNCGKSIVIFKMD